jgi:hypothetical protein
MKRKLTYREIVREFLFFLKKENAYKNYIKAIKEQRKKEFIDWENYINVLTIKSFRGRFVNSGNIGHLIDNSFHWAATKEGHDFWSALNIKWYDKMKDTEIVAEKLTKN